MKVLEKDAPKQLNGKYFQYQGSHLQPLYCSIVQVSDCNYNFLPTAPLWTT